MGTATLEEVASFRGFLLGAHSVAFSPDGRRLAAGSNEREAVKLWDQESHQAVLTLSGHGSMFVQAAFSADGNLLGARPEQGDLHIWQAPPAP